MKKHIVHIQGKQAVNLDEIVVLKWVNVLFFAVGMLVITDIELGGKDSLQLFRNFCLFCYTGMITWKFNVVGMSYIQRKCHFTIGLVQDLTLLSLISFASCFLLNLLFLAGWQRFFVGAISTSQVCETAAAGGGGGMLMFALYHVFRKQQLEEFAPPSSDVPCPLSQPSMENLRRELDTHFMLNALSFLVPLVKKDPTNAERYILRLASVYRFSLVNKKKELVQLEDELSFGRDYCFLLEIRYGQAIQLIDELSVDKAKVCVVPCAIQLLIENAIKHNQFCQEAPLKIFIQNDQHSIIVSNQKSPKPYFPESSKIGIDILKQQYLLLCSMDVIVEETKHYFTVKLPLLY